MATPFQVEIVTPERILFSGQAEEVSMRTEEGEIAFLAHHEDFIGAADVTVVRITTADPGLTTAGGSDAPAEVRVAVAGGFVHVEQDENLVTILAGVAELASEIDVDRARRALERAESAPAGERGDAHGEAEAEADRPARSGAMLALLAPESPEAAAKRARVRLEAAGATTAG
jgi:F-type H+-transporting ATPase subunit epsilon